MKQEYKMLQKEMDEILKINKTTSNTVMKVAGIDFSTYLTDTINAYWKILSKKYGFKPMTVEASSRGKLHFLAEPTPPLPTEEEKENEKYNSVRKIVKEIEKCEFENVAGDLKDFTPFKVLKRKFVKE